MFWRRVQRWSKDLWWLRASIWKMHSSRIHTWSSNNFRSPVRDIISVPLGCFTSQTGIPPPLALSIYTGIPRDSILLNRCLFLHMIWRRCQGSFMTRFRLIGCNQSNCLREIGRPGILSSKFNSFRLRFSHSPFRFSYPRLFLGLRTRSVSPLYSTVTSSFSLRLSRDTVEGQLRSTIPGSSVFLCTNIFA
jgi:hypothetical protein